MSNKQAAMICACILVAVSGFKYTPHKASSIYGVYTWILEILDYAK